jgi:hypothetical protein
MVIDTAGNVSAVDAATVPSGENPAGTAAIAAGTIKATDTAGNELATNANTKPLASGVVSTGTNAGTSLTVAINAGTLQAGYAMVLTSAATGATATATVSSLNGGTGLPSTAPTLTLSAAPAGYTPAVGDQWVAVQASSGSGGSGNGPIPYPFQVNDCNGNPLYNCAVTVYLDREMTMPVAGTGTLYTSQNGTVIFNLEPGLYYFHRAALNFEFDPDPVEVTVSA